MNGTHRRSSLLLFPALAAGLLTPAQGQFKFLDLADIDRTSPPAHWQIRPAPPRSAEETARMLDVPSGFRVEVVAAEPLVQDPIALAFDERGRIWVLEWPSYNWGLRVAFPDFEQREPPKSRLVILKDTNGDGRVDERTVFLDGFDWPRGFQLHRDGVILFTLPEIVFARDTTGDGKADHLEVLIDNLDIPTNPHAAPSSPLRAMDNWIYSHRIPQRVRDSDGSWRRKLTPVVTGQWGLNQDNYGRFVFSYNQDHLRGSLVPQHYYSRNPDLRSRPGLDERLADDQTVWPSASTPGVNRRAQLREDDGTLRLFTANTGPIIYRGDQFPPEFVGNAFIGETAGRLVRRSILSETDGLIRAENAYDRREFIFSRDERFRPTALTTGPDGALYIADMYRGIIEGEIFVTTFLYNQALDRRLHHPFNGMGRIYRVVHERRPAVHEPPRIDYGDGAGWVEYLAHSNGFWRDTAQRLIVESGDRRAFPALRRMAAGHRDELARLHALWTLEGLGLVDESIAIRALGDSSFRIRQAALRLSEPLLDHADLSRRVLALAEDPRIEVRRQLLFTLGEGRGEVFERAMIEVLLADAGQPIMPEAAISGLHGREETFAAALLSDPAWQQERPGLDRTFRLLAACVMNSKQVDRVERLLTEVAHGLKAAWARTALLDGLVSAENKELERLPESLAALLRSPDDFIALKADEFARAVNVVAAVPARPAVDLDAPILQRGRSLYGLCGACHGMEGQGQPGIAPALEGSPFVTGDAVELIRTVIRGRDQNPAYPDMPPLSGLPDADIAAIVSYVRARWAGQPELVSVEQVQEQR